MKKIREHTILFTEACPLECRYCFIKDGPEYGKNPEMTRKEILDKIAEIDKNDKKEEVISSLLLTGGEPFLYFDLIKEIMQKYGRRFHYKFNTSGYPLDKEKIEFLSNYDVEFVLSIDGDEKLTNYLRPNKTNPYRVGYFKKVKEIFPILLYYFPDTPYRIIISPRYVDKLYEMYLLAEQLGFRYFTFILDFESRPDAPVKKDFVIEWSDKYTEKLNEQVQKIVQEILLGFITNIQKPEVIEINQVLKFLALKADKPFSPDNYPCQVFSGRSLTSLIQSNTSFCMSGNFSSYEEARQAILSEYEKIDGKCPTDPNCPAFKYCCAESCPKNNLDSFNSFFKIETLDCALKKVCYKNALCLLDVGEQMCGESKIFQRFLKKNGFGGEVNGG